MGFSRQDYWNGVPSETYSNLFVLPLKMRLVFFSCASGPKWKLVIADWGGHSLLPGWGFVRKEALLVKATHEWEIEKIGRAHV